MTDVIQSGIAATGISGASTLTRSTASSMIIKLGSKRVKQHCRVGIRGKPAATFRDCRNVLAIAWRR